MNGFQDPKLYLVDIRHLAYSLVDDTFMRRITDNMQWSSNRVNAIDYMTSCLRDHLGESMLKKRVDYFFPITTYHSRWSQLSKEDYGIDNKCFFGYWIKLHSKSFDEVDIKSRINAEPVEITSANLQFLSDFLDFCDIFGKKIIFTKTPNCLEEEQWGKYNYIQNIIEKRGYEVWDLNRCVDEIGLDYSSDFADDMHTNVYGSQKVSLYVAKQLMARFQFKDHRGDLRYLPYVEMSERFHDRLREEELRNCHDFLEYLDRLIALDKNKYSVFIAVKDIQGYCLNSKATDKLKTMGFSRADILLEKVYHMFIGLLANDSVIAQNIGEEKEPVIYNGEINGQKVSMVSKCWEGGNCAVIKLGNHDYSKNGRGFNIVVVNNEMGEVVDTVVFDTHVESIPCYR